MSAPAAPVHVLVVDDDEDTSALLGSWLRRQGWAATFVHDLAQARVALGEGEISALVTDLSLPDGSGLSLLSNGRPPPLRAAIVMTGWSGDAERREAEQRGFDAYFVKPLDATQLVGRLRQLLEPSSADAAAEVRNLSCDEQEREP